MVNYDNAYTLYMISFISIGPTISLLADNFRRHGHNRFFYMVSTNLFTSSFLMLISANIAWAHDIDDYTLRVLHTIQYICDAIGAVALGGAYVLRIRVVVNARRATKEISRTADLATWLLAFMPIAYPTVSVIGIVSVWNSSLANCCDGHLSAYIFASFNTAWAINELIMEFYFAFILVQRIHYVSKKRRIKFICIATSLSVVSLGLLAGAIVSFFQAQLGTQIVFAFWLVNAWVFMAMNKQVSRAFCSDQPTSKSKRTSATENPRHTISSSSFIDTSMN